LMPRSTPTAPPFGSSGSGISSSTVTDTNHLLARLRNVADRIRPPWYCFLCRGLPRFLVAAANPLLRSSIPPTEVLHSDSLYSQS
jgi:hypothetical protein